MIAVPTDKGLVVVRAGKRTLLRTADEVQDFRAPGPERRLVEAMWAMVPPRVREATPERTRPPQIEPADRMVLVRLHEGKQPERRIRARVLKLARWGLIDVLDDGRWCLTGAGAEEVAS